MPLPKRKAGPPLRFQQVLQPDNSAGKAVRSKRKRSTAGPGVENVEPGSATRPSKRSKRALPLDSALAGVSRPKARQRTAKAASLETRTHLKKQGPPGQAGPQAASTEAVPEVEVAAEALLDAATAGAPEWQAGLERYTAALARSPMPAAAAVVAPNRSPLSVRPIPQEADRQPIASTSAPDLAWFDPRDVAKVRGLITLIITLW